MTAERNNIVTPIRLIGGEIGFVVRDRIKRGKIMQRRFRPGDKVRLTSEAQEHYDRMGIMTVASVFTHYCPAAKHFSHPKISLCTGHPGFDNGTDCALYEMTNGDNFNNAVYDYELEHAD